MTDDRHDDAERPTEPPAQAMPPREVSPPDAVDETNPVDRDRAAEGAAVDSGVSDRSDETERHDDVTTSMDHDAEAESAPEPSTAPVTGTTAADAADPAGAEAAEAAEAAARGSASSWRRLDAAVRTRKLTAANLIIAFLIGLLGFALIAQVHSNSSESTLANDRPDDLVRILSDLDARRDRLSTEIASLQDTVRQLNSGAQGRQAALAAAAKRANELGILGGTLPATGPGLVINLIPAAKQQISADRVLDTIEELRGAGAEAMQINGTGSAAVRIIASTYFTDATGGVDVDGQTVGGALTVTAIGDPQTMQAALSIAGGVVDSVRNDGGTVAESTPGSVQITALHAAQPLRFATPVS
jgi:uncharacterized protein YlxW (UPF0749 family)